MEQVKWYKRLLCGFNPIGDFADFVCRGTDMQYDLTKTDIKNKTVSVRCWCCTFWRGVVIGVAATLLVSGVVYATIRL